MTKGVFLHRTDSIYDDRPEEQYQFPSQYLTRAAQFVGDWIVYYEPRRGPTARGYFAIARVERIIPDPSVSGMYLALIVPSSYLQFERSVAFSGPDGPVERGLLNQEGKISGRAQAAVRPISIQDFNRILVRRGTAPSSHGHTNDFACRKLGDGGAPALRNGHRARTRGFLHVPDHPGPGVSEGHTRRL